ncbi:MAG: C45 family autoproteolytic acyltransferase/hydrolase [Myxococcota bacterium]|nr:C45 family autoproteolytic acyltransferase/hydrolase [Myxococcota bacterium]
MSSVQELECRGAPRDLGLDQGRAARDPVRLAARRSGARRLRRDPRLQRVERDLERFFPHLSERTQGLARGARVRRRQLAALLARELADHDDRVARAGAGVGLAVTALRGGGEARIARSLDLPSGLESSFAVRRSAPDNDYRSLELSLPWLVAPVAGVNEHGLAAAITTVPPASKALADCMAPAGLLVQDCLQRFDGVEKAVEWCERRPAGGSASILLADAEGQIASVIVDGPGRTLRRPGDEGVLIGLGRSLRRSAIEKGCSEQGRLDAAALYEVLRSHDGHPRGDDDSPCRHGEGQETVGLVILEPARRRLLLLEGPPCLAEPGLLRAFGLED